LGHPDITGDRLWGVRANTNELTPIREVCLDPQVSNFSNTEAVIKPAK